MSPATASVCPATPGLRPPATIATVDCGLCSPCSVCHWWVLQGLTLLKMAAKPAAAPRVVAEVPEAVYPQYPTVEIYTVQKSYPIASVEYPVEMPLSYPAGMNMTYAPVTSPNTPAFYA